MSGVTSPTILSVKLGSDLGGMLFFYFCLIIGFFITFRSIYPGICETLAVNMAF